MNPLVARFLLAFAILAGTLMPATDAFAQTRTPTGVTGERQFDTNARLAGVDITYIDGSYAVNGPCLLARAETPGTVRNGVINPWPEEIRGYPACEFASPIATTSVVGSAPTAQRRPTGVNNQGQFDTGESAAGVSLTYIDGWYADGPCLLSSADEPGNVRNGVVNPWPEETRGFPACVFQPPTALVTSSSAATASSAAAAPSGPAAPARRESGVGKWTWFTSGEQVQGVAIKQQATNQQWQQCRFDVVPFDGWVFDGVVNPYPQEVAQMSLCDINRPSGGSSPLVSSSPPPPPYQAPPPPQQCPAGYYQQGNLCQQQVVVTNPGPPLNQYGCPDGLVRLQGDGCVPPEEPTINGLPRRPSGEGGTISFNAGEAAIAFRITLADGRSADQCYLPAAPTNGTVLSGAVNPRGSEIIYGTCTFSNTGRQATGTNGSLRFQPGAKVSGTYIFLDDSRKFYNCYILSAYIGGVVGGGVINPNDDEIRLMNRCY